MFQLRMWINLTVAVNSYKKLPNTEQRRYYQALDTAKLTKNPNKRLFPNLTNSFEKDI